MGNVIKITGLDEKGRGIGDSPWHIPFVYPGDVVEVEPFNRRKKTGRLVKLIEASSDRQAAPCPYFGHCGGCPWQGLKYEAQLRLKEAAVKQLFGEALPIIPAKETYYYRNRMDFAFGPEYSLGLKDEQNNIINIEKCLLMSEKSNLITQAIRRFAASRQLTNYPGGLMRHAVVREGKNIPNALINILTSDQGTFPLPELWSELNKSVEGITWGINQSLADRSYGNIQQVMGKDYLMESLAGLQFQVPAQSFFQTNIKQAEILLQVVADFAGLQGTEKVYDLYSGTGSIGLSLANRAKEVIGLEENQPAVTLSLENARLNNITNYSALTGRVEELVKSLELAADTIIIDPPRPGIHRRVIQKIGEAKPRKIVYVSCNPHSQKLDVEGLNNYGYKIERCQPLDLFPHTPHIENVILLSLAN